jgi:hypothetical protein
MFSCEYKLHDNFVEIEKPDNEIAIGIQLDAESNGETLYLSESNNIRFDLETSGHEIQRCIFKLGSREWRFDSPTGTFYISGYGHESGLDTMTCDVYVASGTGSIADQIGAESFYGTFSWPVVFLVEPASSLVHTVDDEGFLKLSWKKPALIEADFVCYKIYYGNDICAVIDDVDQLSYVCKSYFGEQGYFTVIAEMKDADKRWNLGQVFLSADIGITADYSQNDSIKVRWDNPYNAAVCVIINEDTLVSYTKDKSAYIPRLFGHADQNVRFVFFPYYEEDRLMDKSMTQFVFLSLSSGLLIALEFNYPRFGYNLAEDVLYVSSYREVTSLFLPDCKKIATYEGDISIEWSNAETYSAPLDHSKMAVRYHRIIELFEGKEMKSVKTILCQPYDGFTGPVSVTKDDKLICFVHDYAGNNIKGLVYNATTGVLEMRYDLPFGCYYSLDNSKMSSDLRYLTFSNGSSLLVITIENYQVTNTRELNLLYASHCFHPFKPEEMYVSSNGKVYLYDCKDLSVKNVWDYPGMNVGNIDPKTGYLLVYGSGYAKIIDTETKQLLFTMPVDDRNEISLFGNMLISKAGYALNLDKYLIK